MTGLPSPVLLTGATGFIGRHLLRLLLDHEVTVRVLVRPASLARAAVDARAEVVPGELADRPALARAVAGVAGVVYGAGAVRGRDYPDFAPANEHGVAAMVEALAESAPEARLVLLSSLAASRPGLSHYAASKRAGERCVEAGPLARWTILRPPAVYGPGDTEMQPLLELVHRGLAVRPGPPGQRLSLIHVQDLVRAVVAALAAGPGCDGRTFTIDDGTPGGYDWAAIAQAVAGRPVRELGVPPALLRAAGAVNLGLSRLLGRAPMLSPGKVRELQQSRWLCDNRAFTHATGWRPELGLEQGARALFS